MISVRCFFDDGTSRKFWECVQRGNKTNDPSRTNREKANLEDLPFIHLSGCRVGEIGESEALESYTLGSIGKLTLSRPKGRRKATESQVRRVEDSIEAELPLEYRKFLLEQNGGIPEPFFVSIPGHPHIDNVAVGDPRGVYGKADPWQSLRFAIDQTMQYLPDGHSANRG